jgi:hypothetical protein
MPRCRDCPARRIADERILRALGIPVEPPVPPHLQGVPRCLHKYEPLLRQSWGERDSREHLARPGSLG